MIVYSRTAQLSTAKPFWNCPNITDGSHYTMRCSSLCQCAPRHTYGLCHWPQPSSTVGDEWLLRGRLAHKLKLCPFRACGNSHPSPSIGWLRYWATGSRMLGPQRLTASLPSDWPNTLSKPPRLHLHCISPLFAVAPCSLLCSSKTAVTGGCALEVTGLDNSNVTLLLVNEAYDWLDAHVRTSSFPSLTVRVHGRICPCRHMQNKKGYEVVSRQVRMLFPVIFGSNITLTAARFLKRLSRLHSLSVSLDLL